MDVTLLTECCIWDRVKKEVSREVEERFYSGEEVGCIKGAEVFWTFCCGIRKSKCHTSSSPSTRLCRD